MSYYIEKGCVGCHYCKNECPAGAIRYKGAGYWIDPEKCISCGKCASLCHLGLIRDESAAPEAAQRHGPVSLDCDMLVIGAGGVGTGTAARGACLGLDVVMIEASSRYGGGTYLAHGASFPGSETVYGRLGLENDLEAMTGFWNMLGGGNIKDQEQLRKNIRANGEFLDWFDSLDPEYCSFFRAAEPGLPFRFDTRGRYLNTESHDDSIGPGWTGSWITEKLFETCMKNGVRYFPKTRAVAFIQDKTGKITGVRATDAGGELCISAKAFVLATGGYLMNDEVMNAIDPCYIRPGAEILRLNVPTNVGDGHFMVRELGGQVDMSYGRSRGPSHHPYCYAVNKLLQSPENVFFDCDGNRFFELKNERPGLPGERIIENPDTPGQKILHNRTGCCYVIMDSAQLEMEGERVAQAAGPAEAYLKNWREDIEAECALEERPSRRADSLCQLAEKLGMEPAFLEGSVARYNALCKKGADDPAFGKAPEHMHAIEKAPFYAFLGQNFDNGASMGGVLIDGYFRVLDKAGQPFEGLYCSGDCASYSPADDQGPVGLCGGLGGSWASGYQIANYIREYLG